MLDGVSLDQIRTFIAAADEGSFSAAGRRLARAQSVISQTLSNLEGQIGVKLFDRSARFPVLTDQGRALLADARTVAGNVDLFKAQAKSLAGGLEPELSVAVDVMFPDATFTGAVVAFQKEFPSTLLRFDVESSAVVDPVLNGRCAVGVVGSWSFAPPQLTHERLLTVRLPIVVSPQHPLATHRGVVPTSVLDQYVHLAHIDLADLSRTLLFKIRYARTWRLSHLGAKLAFLRAGLGFGGMPLHLVEADLASGALVQIAAEDAPPGGHITIMSAIFRTDNPPGPAGRWFIERLKQEDAQRSKEMTARSPASRESAAKRRQSSARRSPARKRKPNR
ncbi:MAG TPA: LysR family transcriptional regulator [Steroidobacteraceae bacterium]|nr:LysR family transcriptional regulator [Steroidobacteraceae bacterium]